MTMQEAIKILTKYNAWRRGAETPMLSTRDVGKAIDLAIEVMQEAQIKAEQKTTARARVFPAGTL